MGIYDEVKDKSGYSYISLGAPIDARESRRLGLSVSDPLQDKLGEVYEAYMGNVTAANPAFSGEATAFEPLAERLGRRYMNNVLENPDAAASRIWTAKRVGVPQWIQDRSEAMKVEAQKRAALLNKGIPDWEWISQTSPITAAYFDDDEVMSSASDDVFLLAEKEAFSQRAGVVQDALRGKLSRGAAGRMAAVGALGGNAVKKGISDAAYAMRHAVAAADRAAVADWEILTDGKRRKKAVKLRPEELQRASDSFLKDARDSFSGLNDLINGTSFAKGAASGAEMSNIAEDAMNLFYFAAGNDEAKWVELERRKLALDRERPEGWFSGLLYETGKFYGQQGAGAWTTGLMSAAGGALGAYGATLGTGLLAAGGVAAAPVLAGGAALTAAFGWWLGARAGVFTQSAKTEAGLDVIDRRMMTDAYGNHMSDFAVGFGSMAVGAVNGALELFEWEAAGKPFMGIAKKAIPAAAMKGVSAAIAGRLNAIPYGWKVAGRAVKDWGVNVFTESLTEVMQDLWPITIDEMQKNGLLDGYDTRTVGNISAQLRETFTSSLYSFALVSAFGPASGVVRKQYSFELARRELEAVETRRMDRSFDDFKARNFATRLFSRLPEMGRVHTERILSGADLSRTFIGAEKVERYFQDGLLPDADEYESAKDWAGDNFGWTAEDYDKSMQEGYELEVAAAKMFDAAGEDGNSALYNVLAKDLRWSRDGMTLGEALEVEKNVSELRRADFFKAAVGYEMEQREEHSAQKVYEALRMQLEDAGRDVGGASADAWVASRIYIPLARMYNDALPESVKKDSAFLPEDLMKMLPVVVERGEGGKVSGLRFDQSVWHGSPHKFDKFSLEHIGSGEGAQAFGWGLYFAGNKEVSEWYRKKLSDYKRDVKILFDNNVVDNISNKPYMYEFLYGNLLPQDYVMHYIKESLELNAHYDLKRCLADFKQYDLIPYATGLPMQKDDTDEDYIPSKKIRKKAQKVLKWLNENEQRIFASVNNSGQLFKVDVPDEADGNYLLWDKAVPAEQMEKVLRELEKRGVALPVDVTINGRSFAGLDYGAMIDELDEIGAAVFERIKAYVYYGDSLAEAINRAMATYEGDITLAGDGHLDKRSVYDKETIFESARTAHEKLAWLEANRDSLSTSIYSLEGLVKTWGEKGRKFYGDLSDKLGSDKDASLLLRDAGIVGIKYLDGNSRRMGEGNYNYVIFDDQDVRIQETFYQGQMNRDVDLSRKIPVLDLTAEKDIASGIAIQDITEYLKALAGSNAEFNDLLSDALISIVGTKVRPSTAAVKRKLQNIASHIAVSGGHVSKGNRALRNAALMAVDRLINHSVLVESVPNYKADKKADVAMYHYFYTPVAIMENGAQKTYTLQIAAEEDVKKQGRLPLKLDLYDLSVRKQISPLRVALPSSQGQPMWQPGDTEISIGEMVHKVKNFWGEDLNQFNRGSIMFPSFDGRPVRIALGAKADRSTFVHELGHFYLWHLKRLAAMDIAANRSMSYSIPQMREADVQSEQVGETNIETLARWNEDLKDIAGWWSENAADIARQAEAFEDKTLLSEEGVRGWIAHGMEADSAAGAAYYRAAQEYFARGFEKYLAEGKAPSKELQGVFRRFKVWMLEIYKSLTELDVELSPEIRRVFDRMVAVDEAVERLRAERRVDALVAAESGEDDAFKRLAEEGEFAFEESDDFYEAVRERLFTKHLEAVSPENLKAMEERAEELRSSVEAEVLSEPGYRAMAMLSEAPEMRLAPSAVMEEFGDGVLEALPDEVLFEDGFLDLQAAANNLGFDTAKDMINAVAGRRGLKDEVEARIMARVEAEFSGKSGDVDADAEAASYEDESVGARLEAEAAADFDDVLDAQEAEERGLAAEESEFMAIFEADDAAHAAQDNPKSRENVVRFIKENGRLNYQSVKTIFGNEQAAELLSRCGRGLFNFRKAGKALDYAGGAGIGIDVAAESMMSLGAVFGSEGKNADQDLFDVLMGPDSPVSPLDLARAEGRAEVADRYRNAFKKIKTSAVKDKKKLMAFKKKLKADYDAVVAGSLEKFKAMKAQERQKAADRQQSEKLGRDFRKFMKSLGKIVEKSVDKKSLRGGAKLAAENAVVSMDIQELYDVAGWVHVEKDARAAGYKALRSFDESAFKRARSKELHAHEMIKAMYRARNKVEYIRSRMAMYKARGRNVTFGMDAKFVYQLDALGSRFDTGRRSKKEINELKAEDMSRGAVALSEFVEEQAKDGVPLLIPDWIVRSNKAWKIEALKMYELEEVWRSIQNLVTVGRDEKRTLAREKNVQLTDIEAQVLLRSQGYFGRDKVHGRTVIEVARKAPKLAADVLRDLDTAEDMCRALDGYEDFGPMQDFVFRPVREAVSREYAELNRIFGAFHDLKHKVYGAGFVVDRKKFDIGVPEYERLTDPETGKPFYKKSGNMSLFTKEELICAALNMGNADNIARLHDGWGWTDADLASICEQLTEADWKYVQGVWDLLETMWPQIKAVHELMTGTTIQKVDAQKLVTKYGELRGGYYPIVTDLRYSERAAAQAERQEVMASAPLDHAQRYAKSGHRKARAENVLGRPPLLSFEVLDNHIANVIHDYELSPVIRDARKILGRDTVRSVVKSVFGDRGLRNLNGWLNDVAANTKNNGVVRGPGDRIVNGLKANTAMFALGGNLGGALMQPLGYFPLAHRIGAVNTALAILNGLSHGPDVYAFAREHSAFMREQMENGNSEVRKLRQNWTTNDHGISKAGDLMLSIYPLLQNMCNVPGWVQCYKVGLEKYGTEKEAVAYADSLIRQTQGASTVADLNSFERSGTVGQMFTMFYSWFRVMYQMQNEAVSKVRYEHGLWNKSKDLASYTLYVLIAQSVAEALLRGNGPDPDDDDDYKWVRWTAGRLLLGPLSTIPVARELGNFIDSDFKFGVKMSPIQSAFDAVGKSVARAYKQIDKAMEGDDADWSVVGEAGATIAGYVTGVPNRKMIQAAMAFWKYFDEGEAVPWLYLLLGGGHRPKGKED